MRLWEREAQTAFPSQRPIYLYHTPVLHPCPLMNVIPQSDECHGWSYNRIRPRRVARTTASVRLCTPSLLMMALT